jgi:hypothetical protein
MNLLTKHLTRCFWLKSRWDQSFSWAKVSAKNWPILWSHPLTTGHYHSLLSEAQKGRIDRFLRKMFRIGLTNKIFDYNNLIDTADYILINKCRDNNLCLNHLLPAVKGSTKSLRCRGHPYILPYCNFEMHKQSFICRCLFNYI